MGERGGGDGRDPRDHRRHRPRRRMLAAARHAAGTEPVAYDEPVDLTEYDLAFAGREDNA